MPEKNEKQLESMMGGKVEELWRKWKDEFWT